ncbi:MAG: hypothetical protein M1826_001903 [Phylliscum demangeonii]|nr:MAG: hypothetical protein M1826_001903 [Phylliscum demangeonii]
MDGRVARHLKIGLVVLCALILAVMLRMLFTSDDAFLVHSFGLPGGFTYGAWSPSHRSPPPSPSLAPIMVGPSISNQATIGMVTIISGGTNPTYERALTTHEDHAPIHADPRHVLRHAILPGIWTQAGSLLALLLQELTKPATERLQWLVSVVARRRRAPLLPRSPTPAADGSTPTP